MGAWNGPVFFVRNSAKKGVGTRASIAARNHAAAINEPIDRPVKLMLFIFDWIEVGALGVARITVITNYSFEPASLITRSRRMKRASETRGYYWLAK